MPQTWGQGLYVDLLAPSLSADRQFRHWWARLERLGASPGAAMALRRMNGQIDLRPVLPGHSGADAHPPSLWRPGFVGRRGPLLGGPDSRSKVCRVARDRPSAVGRRSGRRPRRGRRVPHRRPARAGARPGAGNRAVHRYRQLHGAGGRTGRTMAAPPGELRWRRATRAGPVRGREIDTAGDGFLGRPLTDQPGAFDAPTTRDAVPTWGQIRAGLHTGECGSHGGQACRHCRAYWCPRGGEGRAGRGAGLKTA